MFSIILVMATIQISTSKKPIMGATFLNPFVIKMILMVSSVTSQILIMKINKGRMRKSKTGEFIISIGRSFYLLANLLRIPLQN
jgi:hypothetical protein